MKTCMYYSDYSVYFSFKHKLIAGWFNLLGSNWDVLPVIDTSIHRQSLDSPLHCEVTAGGHNMNSYSNIYLNGLL